MVAFYETIPDSLIPWIVTQKMFWVATAPLSGSGHVNVSPKSGEHFFGVTDNKTFWYLELTGSSCETLAHLHETGNGRVTIMLSAFEGASKIVRLWGKGSVLEYDSVEFQAFVSAHDVKTIPGTRSIIIVDIHQVGSSCGFSVPFYEFKGYRDILIEYFRKKDLEFQQGDEKESMDRYWARKSQYSMDGLPAMKRAVEFAKREKIAPRKKMVGPLAPEFSYSKRYAADFRALAFVFLGFVLGILVAVYAAPLVFVASSCKEPFKLTVFI